VLEVPNGLSTESWYPQRTSVVTRTRRWSSVRMQQPGSATIRFLAVAIVKRYMGLHVFSDRLITFSAIFDLTEALALQCFKPRSDPVQTPFKPWSAASGTWCFLKLSVFSRKTE
jgi:hypothetical protein